MKRKPLATVLVVILAIVCWGAQVQSEETKQVGRCITYSACIDDLIAKNELKATRFDSRSPKIQKTAELAKLKAAYLSNYKDLIIQDMARHNLEPKSYKISHFINEKFFAVVQSPQRTMAEAYSRPDFPRVQDRDRQIASYYARIEDQIKKCDRQAVMRSSKFSNGKEVGEIARLKADFLRKNKGLLVLGMLESSIDPTDYKIDHYINSRFFPTIRSR